MKAAILYLTKKERALASDFVNCSEVDRRNGPVWQQMDECRHALGCDTLVGNHKRVRTYEHFVLSPDPRDKVDLATLRELATEWARTYFSNYQIAIYYHDDNELHIPHAHLIVNNANLEKPGRVSTILTPQFEAKMFAGLQCMAAARGLHAFTEKSTSVNNAEWAKADRAHKASGAAVPYQPKVTVQRTYVTKQDKELEGKGISWKADVRDRVACALRMSTTEEEFLAACEALRLGVRRSAARKGRGDWVYTHPGKETWQVCGARLGRDWSRWGIQRRLASDRQREVAKPTGASRDRLLATMGSLSTSDGAMAMQVLGVADGIPVTAKAVTDMLEVCGRLDVCSMDDFGEALREPMPPDERARVREAMQLARVLGYLPKGRDLVNGPRSSYDERHERPSGSRGYVENDGGVTTSLSEALCEERADDRARTDAVCQR